MLAAIHDAHDPHHEHEQAHSLANLTAARHDTMTKHLLLAASGSVATIKIPDVIKSLSKHQGKLSIRIILTSAARQFLNGQSAEQPTVSALLHMPNVEAVYEDADEWGPHPWKRGASILHIELRRWADILVVAPLSANTLAKVVNGMSDSLLTSVIRAWDTDGSIDNKKKMIVVAPAMNSAMWRHPVTGKQIRVLAEDWGVKEEEPVTTSNEGESDLSGGWFQVIMPISKTLACGDTGDSAMASVDTIREVIEVRLGLAA
ncbi:flavoprotein-domain-containing protein [Apodospora peruviana]|uniref:Flavoprotein-domain-containing protein n=1 Tax=Apodospora peruviana TaxID=516989 RepID=A0AAE0IJP1_9PEZI|nr:flavoprotein-domain-containing protein [Apodospora peruviana]